MNLKMRTDFVLDTVPVELPVSHFFPNGTYLVRFGSWITTENFVGRVLGRVVFEGTIYIYCFFLDKTLQNLDVQWVLPEEVQFCTDREPVELLALASIDVDQDDQYSMVTKLQKFVSTKLSMGSSSI